jgi:hypothetical protein
MFIEWITTRFPFQKEVAERAIPSTKMPLGNNEFDVPKPLETTTNVTRAELVNFTDRRALASFR